MNNSISIFKKKLLLCFCMFIFMFCEKKPEVVPTRNIYGKVKSVNQIGLKVELLNTNYVGFTDSLNRFEIKNVPAGYYDIKVSDPKGIYGNDYLFNYNHIINIPYFVTDLILGIKPTNRIDNVTCKYILDSTYYVCDVKSTNTVKTLKPVWVLGIISLTKNVDPENFYYDNFRDTSYNIDFNPFPTFGELLVDAKWYSVGINLKDLPSLKGKKFYFKIYPVNIELYGGEVGGSIIVPFTNRGILTSYNNYASEVFEVKVPN